MGLLRGQGKSLIPSILSIARLTTSVSETTSRWCRPRPRWSCRIPPAGGSRRSSGRCSAPSSSDSSTASCSPAETPVRKSWPSVSWSSASRSSASWPARTPSKYHSNSGPSQRRDQWRRQRRLHQNRIRRSRQKTGRRRLPHEKSLPGSLLHGTRLQKRRHEEPQEHLRVLGRWNHELREGIPQLLRHQEKRRGWKGRQG